MDHKDCWKQKLTPFDTELAKMVASLTGKPCELKDGGDHFFFEADYRNHNDPDYIAAIMAAVEGRTGDRLIEMSDDPDRMAVYIRVKFAKSEYADFVPVHTDGQAAARPGGVYCKKMEEIRAIQVKRTNEKELKQFVGNGELVIERGLDGRAWFEFKNGDRISRAIENSYIICRGPECFTIAHQAQFEAEYEPK